MDFALADDIVNKIFRGSRQHKSSDAVHRHEHEPERKQPPPRLDQRPNVRKILPGVLALFLFLFAFRAHLDSPSILSLWMRPTAQKLYKTRLAVRLGKHHS